MLQLFIVWIVSAVSLLILSALPLGIDIDGFGTALIAALVLGVLNALVRPILAFFTLPLTFLTLGLFSFVLNALIFALAAALVDGFRVRGCLSALIGPIVFGFLNSIIFAILR